MKLLLSLLLATLVAVSVQQCSIEDFNALEFVQTTETTDFNQNFTINSTFYNCLQTSSTIGLYETMSVSILFIRSDDLNVLREVRYNLACNVDTWVRGGVEIRAALQNNNTRLNCSSCSDQNVNEYHCTPCDSSCTGLNQCYGSSASECCSYNDGGMCTDDCGMNREGNSTFHCVCSNFWTGTNCTVCSLVCQNNGTQSSDCFSCQCVAGFTGTNCETNINECDPMPCQNNGTCMDGIDSYSCTCMTGFTGTDCETNIDDCAPMPCQNNGTCMDGIDSYRCTCVTGFTGTDCETDINDCDPNPCKNGGTCTDGVNGFTCTCNPVYSGADCSGCAMLNCEQCKESDKNEGECTECAGVFVLHQGTCNNNCDIPNCIACDVVTNKCIRCEEGYNVDDDEGKCEEETPPKEEGQNDDGLGAGSIIGIVIACIAGLIILILIIIAIIAVLYERRKRVRKAKLKVTNPDLFDRGNAQKYTNPTYINPEALVDDDELAANSNNSNNNGNQDIDKGEKEKLKEHFGVDL